MSTQAVTDLDARLRRVPEVCKLLGLGKTKVYELIAEGRLRAVKIDGATRVPNTAIVAFTASLPTFATESRAP